MNEMESIGKRIVIFFVVALSVNSLSAQILTEHSYKFSKVLDYISNYYVDSVDQDKLVETAIIEMLKELDPHTVYLSKDKLKQTNEKLQGNFEGIGIQYNILNDTIFVVKSIPGGPSERVGLRAGDRIIKVEDENVAGIEITNKGVRDRLMGKKGTQVDVTVKRKGEKKPLEFTIIRDKIPIHSVDASYLVNSKTGYVKLNRFSATSSEEIYEAFMELKEAGMKNLILDLRGNGGGYLNVAIDLSDHFLKADKLIVYTEGLNYPKTESKSTTRGEFEKGRLVIIIDEGSASASEIVAGAVQDWDRGIIVGRRSFGKGLVQRPFHLPDGSQMRLTTARYYTPTGRLIQKNYENGYTNYKGELMERYKHGEYTHADSIQFADSLKFHTLKNKRIVYGGGGIMPDAFVPLDTTNYSDYYRDLVRKAIINTFCLRYLDKNRKTLKKEYPDFEKFNKKFIVTDQMLNDLVAYAESEGLEPNTNDFEVSKEEIRILIKAYLAADIWSLNEYYQIINTINPTFLKAVKIISNKKEYRKILTGK